MALDRVLVERVREPLPVADEDLVSEVLSDAGTRDALRARIDGDHVDRKDVGELLADLAEEDASHHAGGRPGEIDAAPLLRGAPLDAAGGKEERDLVLIQRGIRGHVDLRSL